MPSEVMRSLGEVMSVRQPARVNANTDKRNIFIINETWTTLKKENSSSSRISIGYVLLMILSAYAVYLSFKCNKGFDLGGFFSALIFPMLYIPYK